MPQHNQIRDVSGYLRLLMKKPMSRKQRKCLMHCMWVLAPLLGSGLGAAAAAGVAVDAYVSASSAAILASMGQAASESAMKTALSTEAHIAIGVAIGFAVLLLAVAIALGVDKHRRLEKVREISMGPGEGPRKASSSILEASRGTLRGRALVSKVQGENPRGENESVRAYKERLCRLLTQAQKPQKEDTFTSTSLPGRFG